MTERRTLPEIRQTALRDHATVEVVQRVWSTLAPALESARRERPSLVWWVPAAAVALFGSGVVVGVELGSRAPAPALQPEARLQAPAAPATTAEAEPRQKPEAPETPLKQATRPDYSRRVLPAALPAVSVPVATLDAPTASLTPATEQPTSAPAWQSLATQLDYDAASAALASQGGFQAALPTASPDQLMTLHDIARATGHRIHAIEALRLVVDQHPEDPNAPVAAWSLANMLESAGDRASAAQAYAAYRTLSPQGDFAEDALARQVQIVREQGDMVRARQMARQYVQEFSNGRHVEEMRQLAIVPPAPNNEGVPQLASPDSEVVPAVEPKPMETTGSTE